MTDSLFDPEREGEETARGAADELLPDPGFASSLFDEPSEESPSRAGVGISEETLFPADPIFFSEKEDLTDATAESDASEPSLPETAGIAPSEEAVEMLDDSEALFDPITHSAASVSSVSEEVEADETLGLFHVPESEAGKGLSTAAFYAASELPFADEKSEDAKEDGSAPAAAPTPSKQKRARKKARRIRELSPEELLARRREAERRVGGAKLRFCIAAALTLLLAVVEIFPSFGLRVTMPLGISRIPGAEALLDLQILLLVALCAYRSVAVGVRSIVCRRLRYEGILSLLLLLCMIYDVVLYATGVREASLVSLVLAVALSATVWVEMSESRVELGILALLADPNGVSAALPCDEGEHLRVAHLEHADGFDEHIGDHEENSHFRFLILLGVLGVGVLGLIAAVVLEGEISPFAAALSAALLALPSGALLSRRIYLSAMQELLLSRRTALIGESAAYAAASHGVFSVDDSEAFDSGDLKIKIINVFGDFRLDEAVRLVAGVYRPIGGALAEVLSAMCEEAGGPREAELVEVAENGVVAHSGGRTVALGTHAFMSGNHVAFPSDAGEESLLAGERLTVLYCAVDGAVVARLFIEYTLSSGFENLADQLARLGSSIELRTADPCLSSEYLLRLSSLPRGVLSLRRVGVSELLSEKCTRAESTFFTTDRPRSLVGAWLAFRRYLVARRGAELLVLLQLMLGALFFGVAVFCFGTATLPSSLVALYHLLTVLAATCGAGAFCRRLLSDAPDPDTESKGIDS